MALLDEVRALTGITTYSAADSEVVIANFVLSDYTKVTIETTELNKVETGVDVNYHVPVSIAPTTTISISLLADSDDCIFIDNLQDFIQVNGGYFSITINNNGRFVGNYSCYFLNQSDLDIDVDPEDEVYVFGAIREDRGIYSRSLFRENPLQTQESNPNLVKTYPYEFYEPLGGISAISP